MLLSKLSESDWLSDHKLISPVVNALSDLAFLCEVGVVPVKQVLSTYHLVVLREGWIIEPYIYYYTLEKNPGRWGMRALQLLQAARDYHDMNPIHGQVVYILDSESKNLTALGMVWDKKPRAWLERVILRILWVMGVIPSISERKKRTQHIHLEEIRRRFEHLKRTQGTP
jgi:hypothetical protein